MLVLLGCSWLLPPIEEKNSIQSLTGGRGVNHILLCDFVGLRFKILGNYEKMIIEYVEFVE
jgi:hypothetical protein